MTRRSRGIAAAVLLLAATVATACSDRGKPFAGARQDARPIAPRTASPSPAVAEPASVVAEPPPATTGPVSFAEGEHAYHARDYAEAARIFARYVEQRPNNAWGHFMLGLSSWKNGDPTVAVDAFNDALRLDSRHLKSLVNLSRVLLDLDRTGEAIETLARARELDASSGEVHRLLGRAYHKQGQPADAMEAYRQAIELDMQDSWAMNNLGLLLLEQGRASDALPLLARAVELRGDVATFQNNLGMALEHTGRFTAAGAAYASAVAADPDYDKAQRNLARVERVHGSPQEPFDLEATARRFIDVVMTWDTATLVTP